MQLLALYSYVTTEKFLVAFGLESLADREQLMDASIVGQSGGSPSECIMLIPSWEAFEQASKSQF